jgi:hypothetical protein
MLEMRPGEIKMSIHCVLLPGAVGTRQSLGVWGLLRPARNDSGCQVFISILDVGGQA